MCDCGPGNSSVSSINIASALNLSLFGQSGQVNATARDINGAV
ncbi:MAG: hypothetical protein U0176_08020 [Bacteroidia bacterium]